jgi:hypothetical protein
MTGDPFWETTGTVYVLVRRDDTHDIQLTAYATSEDAQRAKQPGQKIRAVKVWRSK